MGTNRPRRKPNKFVTTKSGKQLKIHRSIADRFKSKNDEKARRKAERLRGLPKSRLKRIAWRMHPKRLAAYWFSRDGLIMGLKITGIGIVILFVLTLGVFAYFRKDLPNLKDISGNNIGGSIQYYDRTGKVLLWEDYGNVRRIPVQSKDIPQNIKEATVAIEDRDFYHHRGFNTKGIFRAGLNNIFGGSTQGGSTITQQLVKLTQDWTKDHTFKRKIKELILAVELERTYTKDEILTAYLNDAPYGNVINGVESASENYFRKPANQLTLSESAMLASIPKSPLIYSPYNATDGDFDRQAFLSRQHYTLDVMASTGKITQKQADDAKKVDVIGEVQPLETKYQNIKAPYFVLAAKKELAQKYLPSDGTGTAKIGGWKVTTTLDLNLQGIAEDEVSKGLPQIKRQGGDTAAFAAEDVKTGQMVALVGGVDFSNPTYGQNNYAQLPLPPGSSFKPYDYTTLIDSTTNFGAGSVLYDAQGPLEGYPCTNKTLPPPKGTGNCLEDYDFRYPGPLTLRYALGGSRNVPAVKAMLIAGEDKVINTAQKMGLVSGYRCYDPGTNDFTKEHETQCYAAAAIGDGAYLHLDEHVNGFSTISREGVYLPKTYIMKIVDGNNQIIDEWKQPAGQQVVRPDAAYIVADILSDPNASYFPAGRKPQRYNGWKFAMKTGTTAEGKDGWMMGFSTKYAAGVWVGYHTRTVAMSGTMENMTQPIWQGWMRRAHDPLKPEDWPKPADLQTLPAFVIRSHVGIGSVEPSPSKDLFPAWYKAKSTSTVNRTIDKVSNKLATDCTPNRARQDVNDAGADSFSGDTFVGTGGANTDQKDDVHNCDDVKPSVSFTSANFVSLGGGTYRLTATATAGTHPLSSDAYPGTIIFTANGLPVDGCPNGCSATVNASGNVLIDFVPTGSGSVDITATVIDSVLYDASSAPVTVSYAPAVSLNLTATKSGNKAKFSWNDISDAPYKVCYSGPATNCLPVTSNTTITSGNLPAGNYSATVTSSGGTISNTVNFTI